MAANDKLRELQAELEGTLVAKMIYDFHTELRGIYGDNVMTSSLCAVGPLQTMIGLAIRNGHLKVTK